MDWKPIGWLIILIIAEIVKFKAAYMVLKYWNFLK